MITVDTQEIIPGATYLDQADSGRARLRKTSSSKVIKVQTLESSWWIQRICTW
ncbi:hypothetical protein C8Q77DRAFT_1118198 [Trametes polyzona]|nr:hypothetical protein C8Q77DRAFT_1118198 [Trametes polyzona]